nr:hypothetical protein [Massilia oculi]
MKKPARVAGFLLGGMTPAPAEFDRRKKTGPQAGLSYRSNELLGGSSSVSSLLSRTLSSSSCVGCGVGSSSSVSGSSVSSSWCGCVSSWGSGCVSWCSSSWGFGSSWCDWSFFFLSASSQGNSEQGGDQQGFFHDFSLVFTRVEHLLRLIITGNYFSVEFSCFQK